MILVALLLLVIAFSVEIKFLLMIVQQWVEVASILKSPAVLLALQVPAMHLKMVLNSKIVCMGSGTEILPITTQPPYWLMSVPMLPLYQAKSKLLAEVVGYMLGWEGLLLSPYLTALLHATVQCLVGEYLWASMKMQETILSRSKTVTLLIAPLMKVAEAFICCMPLSQLRCETISTLPLGSYSGITLQGTMVACSS